MRRRKFTISSQISIPAPACPVDTSCSKGGVLHRHGVTLVEQDGRVHRKTPLPPGSAKAPPEDLKPPTPTPSVPEPSRRARRGIDEEARRKAWAAIPEGDPGDESETCPIDRTPSIREVPRVSRPLISISPTWSCWAGKIPLIHGETMKGAIVRLYPPADATPARIEEVSAECISLGAVAVKVMPREQGDQVLRLDVAASDGAPLRTTRDVLRELVGSAHTDDREALWKVVEQAIEEGERQAPPAIEPSQGESIWIERVVLRNWFRYRGEHVIDLKPTVYGITATTEGDPERSNWQGKSSLLNAIAFALYGWLPEYVRGADDWITRGEGEGGVRLLLSDGTIIERIRKRGKSTQLSMGKGELGQAGSKGFVGHLSGDGRPGGLANQGEAQNQIVSLLGLTEEDFFATSFFPQKEIAKLIKLKPAPRLEVVRGWLDLAPLGAAEEWAQGQLEKTAGKDRALGVDLRGWEEQIMIRRKDAGIPENVSDRSDTLTWFDHEAADRDQWAFHLGERAREAEQKIAGLDGWERDERTWVASQGVLNDLGALERQKKTIAIRVEGALLDLPKLKEREAGIKAELTRAQDEARAKCQLAMGKFDGICPVAGLTCPIASQINGDRERNLELRNEAELALGRIGIEHRQVKTEIQERESWIREGEQLDRKLAELSAKLEGMKPSIARIEKDGHPPNRTSLPDPRPIWKEASDAEQRRRILEEAREGIVKAWSKIDEIKIAREKLSREIQILREALIILGKGGAQKVIAVSELARIEALANDLLGQNGIDLSVQVKWGRESSTQLSPSCEKCGRSGISGQGKTCPGCGAARSPKVSEKLDVELSDRSGAAEDLGGLALQIAASTWLRERRGARLGVVCIDEPFGALDPSHARSLAVHLAGILRGRSFKQGFVIAHTSSAMDALPGRIRVTGMHDGSSNVEVLDG